MDQLYSEIDRISGATQFNGVGLLDGSGGTKTFQIGANSGQTISVALRSTKTQDLNLNGYSKLGELNSGRVGALNATGLAINGTAIGAAAAATAKAGAAAINLKTGDTGVTATAYNTLKGAGGNSGIVTGLTINGDTISASGNMTELVNNINRDAAGVTATLNKDGSLTLSNDTGDDIQVGGTVTNSGLTGATYHGYISLTDDGNQAISITAKTGYTAADVNKWGFNISTGSTAVTGKSVSSVALAAGDLVINGISVGASTGSSAGDKAAAINLVKATTGVTASATTEVKLTVDMAKVTASSLAATDLNINGSSVNLTGASNMDAVVTAINAAVKGVVASADTDGKLVLTSVSGLDIKVTDAKSLMGGTNTTRGTISLTSDTGADIKIAGTAASSGASALSAGFAEQGGSSEAVGQGLSVETLANANNAIDRIDDALNKVADNRAELGAVQNRLDSTISNLQNASENFSAANGRIIDADFAKETASMSKQQIMMQAGVAMLAQAKQLPQQVLQLLQ
jgi:flagellin